MEWLKKWLGRTPEAQPEPVVAPNTVPDALAHLTPAQKLVYAHTEARRIVSESRDEIQRNKQRSAYELEQANKVPIARIKAAEAMYAKVKAEVK